MAHDERRKEIVEEQSDDDIPIAQFKRKVGKVAQHHVVVVIPTLLLLLITPPNKVVERAPSMPINRILIMMTS
jgi:hypothetical protein